MVRSGSSNRRSNLAWPQRRGPTLSSSREHAPASDARPSKPSPGGEPTSGSLPAAGTGWRRPAGRSKPPAVEEAFGPIDISVNDAMVTVFSPVKEMLPEQYLRVTEVTYLGYVYGTLAALKYMLPRDRGTIVQVGSALVYRSIPLQSAYCGAKAAIRGFTDSLRAELLHDGSHVRVSMVQLPAVNTPQFGWGENHVGAPARPVAPVFQPEVA